MRPRPATSRALGGQSQAHGLNDSPYWPSVLLFMERAWFFRT